MGPTWSYLSTSLLVIKFYSASSHLLDYMSGKPPESTEWSTQAHFY